jgi:hypothetical protein
MLSKRRNDAFGGPDAEVANSCGVRTSAERSPAPWAAGIVTKAPHEPSIGAASTPDKENPGRVTGPGAGRFDRSV